MTVVVGTAGHVDHGKTALLRALTGIDADRLPEERRRGMTIDVGYAHLPLADGTSIDFVDVPGHEQLVGDMLVGAGEIDAAMLVISAADGPRAQTIEHLELLDGLAIEHGLAVLTKVDLVDAQRRADVMREIHALLASTSLAGSPVLTASAVTGEGLDALRAALVALKDRLEGRPDVGAEPWRMAIDRVFVVRGRGAVVTGTQRGRGSVERGGTVQLQPGDRAVRLREIQVHGRSVPAAQGGGRTAFNLAGIDVPDLRRGMLITVGEGVEVSDRLLVALRQRAAFGRRERPVARDRAHLRLHIGTDQIGVTVGRAGRETVSLASGESTAILRLARPTAMVVGDRFVLRSSAANAMEAAGRVLDIGPPEGPSRQRITPERIAALAQAIEASDVVLIAAARLELHGFKVTAGGLAVAADVEAAIAARAHALVADAPTQEPGRGVPLSRLRREVRRELTRRVALDPRSLDAATDGAIDRLVVGKHLVRRGDHVYPAGTAEIGPTPALLAAMDRLEAALTPVRPPPLAQAAAASSCPPEGVRALERDGRIVIVEADLAWAMSTYRGLESRAVAMAVSEPLSPGVFRTETGLNRSQTIAILEHLDRTGVLRRTPAGHVRGPRAGRDTVDPA